MTRVFQSLGSHQQLSPRKNGYVLADKTERRISLPVQVHIDKLFLDKQSMLPEGESAHEFLAGDCKKKNE